MNSESYGAYKNWLMEKRKISPLITTTTKKNSANLRSMSKKKTLNSYESVEEINPFNSSQSQSDLI